MSALSSLMLVSCSFASSTDCMLSPLNTPEAPRVSQESSVSIYNDVYNNVAQSLTRFDYPVLNGVDIYRGLVSQNTSQNLTEKEQKMYTLVKRFLDMSKKVGSDEIINLDSLIIEYQIAMSVNSEQQRNSLINELKSWKELLRCKYDKLTKELEEKESEYKKLCDNTISIPSYAENVLREIIDKSKEDSGDKSFSVVFNFDKSVKFANCSKLLSTFLMDNFGVDVYNRGVDCDVSSIELVLMK